jgi:hypothetical protein
VPKTRPLGDSAQRRTALEPVPLAIEAQTEVFFWAGKRTKKPDCDGSRNGPG